MHHYKLKEIEVGDTAIRMGKQSTVSAIDDATGRIEWDIVDAADFSSVYKSLLKAKDFLSTLEKEGKAKDDIVIDGFAEDIAKLFNAFRTHVRKEYPNEYERVSRLKESITEAKNITFGDFLDDLDNRFVDILGAAKGVINMRATLNQNFTLFRNYISALKKEYSDELGKELTFTIKEEEIEEMSTTGGGAGAASFSGGTGMQYATPYAFRLKGKKANIKAYKEMGYEEVKEDIGATLGPGPKASSDGVDDNYLVKAFKYSLVPKKIKNSGIEVKQLFEDDTPQLKFQKERVNAFSVIEKELNDIYKMISNAEDETLDYYKDNPSSFEIVKSTDLVIDYLKDIKSLLKQQ